MEKIKASKAMKLSYNVKTSLSVPRAHRSLWYRLSTVTVILSFLSPTNLHPQQTKASEYEVKATYLYNFGRFVQWSPGVVATKGDSFPICVFGPDPFGAVLDTILSGESIGGKAVVAKRVSKPQDALDCRVLYISASEESRLKEILAGLDKAGVLTVSDIPQFSQRGGMIQFVLVGNKIRFEVNLTSAQDAGLTLSSDLLKVAVAVRKSSQPGD
ncbi:MAG TPA: YfiR family protein [Candidatus Acidoferrales bacterium]|nr:YfiR family protein [Candidatus Acidoferrales bacterium]